MTDALEPTRASLDTSPSFRGVLKRTRKPGVAQSGIFSHLARVKKLAKIATLQRIKPVFQTRKNIEQFVADFRERQPAAKTVLAKKADKRKKTDWQKMEMVLPAGGTVSGGQVIPSAGSLSAGSPFTPSNALSAGQVIPPFEAPALEESAFTRRMKQLSQGKSSEKSQPKKRITPQSRLYSKVVEMNPRKPEQDEDLPDTMPQMDTPTPEPRQTPPLIQHARPDRVQRLPEESSLPKPKQARLRPADIQRMPDTNVKPSPEQPAHQTARQASDEAKPVEKPVSSAKPAEKSKLDLLLWQTRQAHPEVRRLSPIRREISTKKQPEVRQSVPQKPEPGETARFEAKAVESAARPVKLPSVPAQTPKPADFEQKFENKPVEKPDNSPKQPIQPTGPQPKTDLPVILKPRIRSMQPAVAPTVIKPHAVVALNVIRRMPEKAFPVSKTFTAQRRLSNVPRTARLTIEPSAGRAGMPVRQADVSQQLSQYAEQPIRELPHKPRVTPVREPAEKPVRRFAQQPVRQTALRQAARPASRSSAYRLILPLQQTMKNNTSQPLSRLTVLMSRPNAIQREPDRTVVRRPAPNSTKPADRPLTIKPSSQPRAQNRSQTRELILQPVITRQVKTFIQSVRQRAENRLPNPAKTAAPATPAAQSAAGLLSMQSAAMLPPSPGLRITGSPYQGGQPTVRRQPEHGLHNTIQRDVDDKPKQSNYISQDEANEEVNELHKPGGYVTEPPTPSNNQQGKPPSGRQYYSTEQQDQEKEDQPVYLQRGNSSPRETRPESSPQTNPEPAKAPYELLTMYESEMPPPVPAVENPPAMEPEVYHFSEPESGEQKDITEQLDYRQVARDLLPIIKKMLALERERTVRR